MYKTNDVFTVALMGDGLLVDMFGVELGLKFPHAKISDRTVRVRKFIQNEIELGSSVHASPEFRRSVPDLRRALHDRTPSDVTVTFQLLKTVENIIVAGRRSSRILTFDRSSARSLEQIVAFVRQVVGAVGVAN